MFYKTPYLFRVAFPKLVWQINTSKKEVYLTFDDGPNPEVTTYVMDELEKYGFKATFFCIGDNVRKYPDTFNEILSRGHGVGNHTFYHVNGWRTPVQDYMNEIDKCSDLVPGRIFRPPYGRITGAQRRILKGKYKIIMWTLLSWDFKKTFKPKRSLWKLKRYTRKGSIVVFHDSIKSRANLKSVLPEYLAYLHKEGYQTGLLE